MPRLCVDIETCPQVRFLEPDVPLKQERLNEVILEAVLAGESGVTGNDVGDVCAGPAWMDQARADGRMPLEATGVTPALHWTTCHVVAVNVEQDRRDGGPQETVYHLSNVGQCSAVGPDNDVQVQRAEALLVAKVLDLIAAAVATRRTVVTFNGKAFDLLILRGRAVALGLNNPVRKSWERWLLYPWNNRDEHCDLRIAISQKIYGVGTFDWLCGALGIPASAKGEQIWRWVRDGAWDEIEAYGLEEARGLAALYERWKDWI